MAVVFLTIEIGVGEVRDQIGQLVAVDLRAGEVLVEDVLASSRSRARLRAVDQPADAAHLFGTET